MFWRGGKDKVEWKKNFLRGESGMHAGIDDRSWREKRLG